MLSIYLSLKLAVAEAFAYAANVVIGKKKQGQRFSFAPVGCLLFTYVGVPR